MTRFLGMAWARAWLWFLLAGLAPVAASAQDLGPILGPLAPAVSLGTSGAWALVLERGRLVMNDADDNGAVRFYTAPWQGDRAGGRSAGIRVTATDMGPAGAGLIYNVRDDFPRWAALVVTADRNVVLYARQQNGLVELERKPLPGGPHAEGELLQVSEKGNITTMYANGVEIGRLRMESNGQQVPGGPVGIMAIGPGRFSFRDFAFGQEVVPQAGGDDRIPGRTGPVAGNDDRVPTPNAPPPTDNRRWPVPQLDPLASNVLGATMGILAHEFGHFMIGELKLPATGPEEDVADEFAAMVFVDNMRDMPEVAGQMALSMAKFWWYQAELTKDRSNGAWFDEHAPDRARFAKIMCMLYGAAPRMFEDVMQETGIPERTRARCIDDERKRHGAWDQLLRGHRRKGVDPVMPGDLDPSTPGKTVSVVFDPPKNPQFNVFKNFLQRSRMIDTLATLLNRLYVLPRDTKLQVTECGVINAFYNPNDGSVTLCYEMLAQVAAVFAKAEGQDGPPAGEERRNPPPPTPAPTPSPDNTFNLAQFLTGIWKVQQRSQQGTIDDILVQAMPDGTYRARHDVQVPGNAQHIVVAVLGRWAAEAAQGDGQFHLVLQPQQWTPSQLCGQDGNCHPLNLTPTNIIVQIRDRNTLVSAAGLGTRIQ